MFLKMGKIKGQFFFYVYVCKYAYVLHVHKHTHLSEGIKLTYQEDSVMFKMHTNHTLILKLFYSYLK